MFNLTPTVRNLLIINVVVFLITSYFFPIKAVDLLALHDFRSENFRPFQLVTHMFMHGGLGHLFSNMFSLFIFGPMLEYRWGASKFLTFYLITGLGASLLYSGVRYYELHSLETEVNQYMASPGPMEFFRVLEDHIPGKYNKDFLVAFKNNPTNPEYIEFSKQWLLNMYNKIVNSPMLGASGAVFGILMAFGLLFPNIELFLLFFPVPIKAKYFVLLYGGYELWAGFNRTPGDNIAHFAHLGGMLFAYILVKFWEGYRSDYK